MAKNPDDAMEEAMRVMGALVRQPPKPHDQMKLGKSRGIRKPNPGKPRKALAPPKRG